jgi:hypothetical protein
MIDVVNNGKRNQHLNLINNKYTIQNSAYSKIIQIMEDNL